MMVNFSNIGTSAAANAKSATNNGETNGQPSGFAALFTALKPATATDQSESAPTQTQLQQLANSLDTSEKQQLLEEAALSPEALAQLVTQLAAQLNGVASTPQSEQPTNAQQQLAAALAGAVSGGESLGELNGTNNLATSVSTALGQLGNQQASQPSNPIAAASATLSQAVAESNKLTSGPLLPANSNKLDRNGQPPMFTTPIASPNQPQSDARAATALQADLKPADYTTPIDTTRPNQTALTEQVMTAKPAAPLLTTSVVMIDAPAAQTAAASPATPSTTVATASLAAPVGSQAWANQLQQNVLQMVMHNQNEMTLRLHPAELGPLQVQLRMDDSAAQLNILTHNQQVRGALEQALPNLREALANQGIQLGESQVNDQGQQFAQQQARQQAQQWAANNGGNNDKNTVETSESAENTDMGLNSRHTAAARNGQVDTFA